MLIKKLIMLMAISFSYAQKSNPIDLVTQELRIVVETASRASQKVFVEDFTGLD